MFGLFLRDPHKRLQKQRTRLMHEAMRYRLEGDTKHFTLKLQELDHIEAQLKSFNR